MERISALLAICFVFNRQCKCRYRLLTFQICIFEARTMTYDNLLLLGLRSHMTYNVYSSNRLQGDVCIYPVCVPYWNVIYILSCLYFLFLCNPYNIATWTTCVYMCFQVLRHKLYIYDIYIFEFWFRYLVYQCTMIFIQQHNLEGNIYFHASNHACRSSHTFNRTREQIIHY